MREVLPGVVHWTTIHPKIRIEVSSYWLDKAGVLIDPFVPPDVGLEWFAARPVPPVAVLLSSRHHYRESGRFAEAFGAAVLCNQAGLHEFTHGEPVQGFAIGDVLPGGVIACEVGVICPDDTALYLPDQRAMAFADGVVTGGPHGGGPLGFVPDMLMDEPENTKKGLLASFGRLLATYEFDHLLLAHGGPVIGDGRRQLEELIAVGGRTAFEM
jgi:glyoxylase-like metal-dependent hydrolase (beta-lactamase superfamily II)